MGIWICLSWTFSYQWNHAICGLLCLSAPLRIMLSRYIDFVACISASFLFVAECHCFDIPNFLLITFVDGCLCFHFNTTTMNICVWVFMWTWVFISLGYIPGSGVAGLYCNFMFSPLRNCQTYPKWLHYFTFLPAVYEFQFLPIFAKTFISLWF